MAARGVLIVLFGRDLNSADVYAHCTAVACQAICTDRPSHLRGFIQAPEYAGYVNTLHRSRGGAQAEAAAAADGAANKCAAHEQEVAAWAPKGTEEATDAEGAPPHFGGLAFATQGLEWGTGEGGPCTVDLLARPGGKDTTAGHGFAVLSSCVMEQQLESPAPAPRAADKGGAAAAGEGRDKEEEEEQEEVRARLGAPAAATAAVSPPAGDEGQAAHLPRWGSALDIAAGSEDRAVAQETCEGTSAAGHAAGVRVEAGEEAAANGMAQKAGAASAAATSGGDGAEEQRVWVVANGDGKGGGVHAGFAKHGSAAPAGVRLRSGITSTEPSSRH